jgi:CHAD domain-containing protein
MFLIDFSEWVEDAPWRDQSLDDDRHAMTRFVCKELRRRRDALSEMAHDLASLDRGAQHKVRLNAKKLRYMALFFVGLSSVADHKRMNRLLICLDKLQTALGDLRDSEARRRMAEAEIRLWRSATRNIDAASLAAAERLAALIGDDGESFRKALKACAKLVKINPF